MSEYNCISCTKILDQMEYNDVTFYDLDCPPVSIVGFDESIICNSCGEELEPESYYVDCELIEELLEKLGEILGDVLSKSIDYCSKCEGSQIEYSKYVYEKEFGDTDIFDSGIDVYDFLSEHNIYTEDLRKVVIYNLRCQCCDHGTPDRDGVSSSFELDDRIYSSHEIDEYYGIDINELNIIGEIYGILFEKEELNDFIDYLYRNPSLSLKHPVGVKFYELLERHYLDNKFRLEVDFILYRGRKRYYDQTEFAHKDLWNPPEGQATHGRYNSIGVSVFYCTDNYEGLPYELNPVKNECIDYGEFKVLKELNIIDVSKLFPEEFAEYFSANSVESKLLKKTYLLTSFISECCKNIGYNGVRYKGVSNKLDYHNFAIFDVKSKDQLIVNKIKKIETEVVYKITNLH